MEKFFKEKVYGNLTGIKKALYYLTAGVFGLAALYYMSAKAALLFLLLALCGFFGFRGRGAVRYAALALMFAAMVFANIFYSATRLADILPFYRYHTQAMYHEDFLEQGAYPDLFLRLLFQDKRIYVRDNLLTQQEKFEAEEYYNRMADFTLYYPYYHRQNAYNFASFFGREVVFDDSMNEAVIPEEKLRQEFLDFGPINDMYRYTFLFSDAHGKYGNYRPYFFYYWYYSAAQSDQRYGEPMKLYVNPGGLLEAKELVLLWREDPVEHLYVMSYDYYTREVAGQWNW